MYKKNLSGQIIRISDGVYIPQDEKNNDYQDFLKWQSKGNSVPQDSESQKEKNQKKINSVFEFINRKSQGKIFCDSILGIIANNLEKSGGSEKDIDELLKQSSISELVQALQVGRINKAKRLIAEGTTNDFLLLSAQREKIIELIDAFLANEN